MDIYGEIVLDHFRHPRRARLIEDAKWQASDSNPLCGDKVTVTLQTDEKGVITDFGFQAEGCAISIASTSLLGEKLAGRQIEELLVMPKEEVLTLLGIPISPGRIKCALLGYSCIKKALINGK